MRQHKYKAWNMQERRWIEDFMDVPITRDLGYTLNGGIKDIVVVEYTGRKDSNGVEIYEGSITKDRHGIGWIVYDNDYASWRVQRHDSWSLLCDVVVKVIGNVQEYSDLTK